MPRKKLVSVSAVATTPKPEGFGAVIAAAEIADVDFAPLPRGGRTSQYLANLLNAIEKGGDEVKARKVAA
jgi:hypothetical protein